MIVRVVTATVPRDHMGAFNALLRTQLPILRAQEGLVYVKLARRLTDHVEEVVLLEEWRDVDSLYRWTGPTLEKPRLVPGAEALAERIEVRYYEALDVVPDPDGS